MSVSGSGEVHVGSGGENFRAEGGNLGLWAAPEVSGPGKGSMAILRKGDRRKIFVVLRVLGHSLLQRWWESG